MVAEAQGLQTFIISRCPVDHQCTGSGSPYKFVSGPDNNT